MNTPIKTVDDLPAEGFVYLTQVVTEDEADPRLLPVKQDTYSKHAKSGKAPKLGKFFGRLTVDAQQLRAFALGQDWKALARK